MVCTLDQKTLTKVAMVKAKDIRPITVLVMESGESSVWEIVTPMLTRC